MQKGLKKEYAIILIKIGLAILLLLFLFKSGRLSVESIVLLFQGKNIPYLILSCFFFLGSQMLSAQRLLLLLRTINYQLSFYKSLYLTLVGIFYSNVIPGAIGGDLVKGYCLFKTEKDNKGTSAGIVVADRILGLCGIIFVAGIFTLHILRKNRDLLLIYRSEILISITTVGMLFMLLIALVLLGRRQHFRNKLRTVLSLVFRKNVFFQMAKGLGSILKYRKTLFYSFIISIAIQLVSLAGLLSLCHISSTEKLPAMVDLFAVSSIVMLFNIIPVTPGNIGWTELVASFGWSIIGSSGGAAIFFYWRIVCIFCSLPCGLSYVFIRKEARNK